MLLVYIVLFVKMKLLIIPRLTTEVQNYGSVAINHGNRYVTVLALLLGRYGIPHAEVNGTE